MEEGEEHSERAQKNVKIFSDGKRKEGNIEVTLREIRELRTEERKDKR